MSTEHSGHSDAEILGIERAEELRVALMADEVAGEILRQAGLRRIEIKMEKYKTHNEDERQQQTINRYRISGVFRSIKALWIPKTIPLAFITAEDLFTVPQVAAQIISEFRLRGSSILQQTDTESGNEEKVAGKPAEQEEETPRQKLEQRHWPPCNIVEYLDMPITHVASPRFPLLQEDSDARYRDRKELHGDEYNYATDESRHRSELELFGLDTTFVEFIDVAVPNPNEVKAFTKKGAIKSWLKRLQQTQASLKDIFYENDIVAYVEDMPSKGPWCLRLAIIPRKIYKVGDPQTLAKKKANRRLATQDGYLRKQVSETDVLNNGRIMVCDRGEPVPSGWGRMANVNFDCDEAGRLLPDEEKSQATLARLQMFAKVGSAPEYRLAVGDTYTNNTFEVSIWRPDKRGQVVPVDDTGISLANSVQAIGLADNTEAPDTDEIMRKLFNSLMASLDKCGGLPLEVTEITDFRTEMPDKSYDEVDLPDGSSTEIYIVGDIAQDKGLNLLEEGDVRALIAKIKQAANSSKSLWVDCSMAPWDSNPSLVRARIYTIPE